MLIRHLAVVGHPVEHSLSPAIQLAAYARLGLDWSYERIDVAPGGLAELVRGLDASWRGLSVTMPHKEDAARIGEPDEEVLRTGVANTLVFEPDGILARNTDVAGYRTSLAAHGVEGPECALVVGNGATARSAVAALAGAGCGAVTLACRSPERGVGVRELASRLGLEARVIGIDEPPGAHDLVISTIPAAGAERYAGALADCAPVVYDSVYDPWPTPLGEAATARGRLVLNGLDLLAGQAVDQVRWFTGAPMDFRLARTTAEEALAGSQRRTR